MEQSDSTLNYPHNIKTTPVKSGMAAVQLISSSNYMNSFWSCVKIVFNLLIYFLT